MTKGEERTQPVKMRSVSVGTYREVRMTQSEFTPLWERTNRQEERRGVKRQ